MHFQATAPVETQVKPSRLNFAGSCIYCRTLGCADPRCVAAHDMSAWQVCRDCDGQSTLLGSPDDPCLCFFGLVEVALPLPFNLDMFAPASVKETLAEAPVSVPPVFVSSPLPRCLVCGFRTAVAHEGCEAEAAFWLPCETCAGRRMDVDGFECQPCCGVGFVQAVAVDTLAERAGEVTCW